VSTHMRIVVVGVCLMLMFLGALLWGYGASYIDPVTVEVETVTE
jgi:hypothetical protein